MKHARKGNKLEVMFAKQTKIDNCSDIFVVSLKGSSVANSQKIAEKNSQNVMVADETGCAKLTLWEQHVGCLQSNKRYYLRNMLLRV